MGNVTELWPFVVTSAGCNRLSLTQTLLKGCQPLRAHDGWLLGKVMFVWINLMFCLQHQHGLYAMQATSGAALSILKKQQWMEWVHYYKHLYPNVYQISFQWSQREWRGGPTCRDTSSGMRKGKRLTHKYFVRQPQFMQINSCFVLFFKLQFKNIRSKNHLFVIMLHVHVCTVWSFFQTSLLAAVYEIAHKPIVLSTYCLPIHLFSFGSEHLWCETPISGAKDIWDYGWALSTSCLFNVKVLNQREWAVSQRIFWSGVLKMKSITSLHTNQILSNKTLREFEI